MRKPSVMSSESQRSKHADTLGRVFGTIILVFAVFIVILELLLIINIQNIIDGKIKLPVIGAADTAVTGSINAHSSSIQGLNLVARTTSS